MHLSRLFITSASQRACTLLVLNEYLDEEMKAVWVLDFPCYVTVPGWTLCFPSVISTGYSHVVS